MKSSLRSTMMAASLAAGCLFPVASQALAVNFTDGYPTAGFPYAGQSLGTNHKSYVGTDGVSLNVWALADSNYNNFSISSSDLTDTGNTGNLLWLRNNNGDRGLGICTQAELAATNSHCGFGDTNEIDNQTMVEKLLLSKSSGSWTSLFVSSLDSNGGAPNLPESGTVYWSNSLNFNSADSFNFTAGDFPHGAVEGDILSLGAANSFNRSAKYVVFTANTTSSATGNNDYVVWKASAVPEPGTLALFGLGLIGLSMSVRRKRHS